jgi:hypothetical protein
MLSGNSLTGVVAPLPLDASTTQPQPDLRDLSCPEPGSCVAVGDYIDVNGHQEGLIDTLHSGTWSAQGAPAPADLSHAPQYEPFSLTTVQCDSTGQCVAIGSYMNASNQMHGVIESEIDGAWTATEAPVPSDAYTSPDPSNDQSSTLEDLSCPTANACVAFGTYVLAQHIPGQPGPAFGIYVDSLVGGVWAANELPLPPDVYSPMGIGPNPTGSLSCAAPGQCTLVGVYYNVAGLTAGLVATLDGGIWTSSTAPVPDNASTAAPLYNSMTSVSCAAPGECVAIGSYVIDGGTGGSEIATLSDGVWTAIEAPLPAADSSTLYLTSVACPAVGLCVAAGNDASSAVFENQQDGTWVPTLAPLPEAIPLHLVFTSPLTCPAAGACNDAIWYSPDYRLVKNLIEVDPSLPPTVTAARAVSGLSGGTAYQAAVASNVGVPTGTVSFFTGATLLCVAAVSGGIATCTSSVPTIPTAPINASYSGNSILAPSTSPVSSFIQPAPPPITPPPSTHGYWLVGSDGGIFTFGSAQFHGSTGALTLQRPVVGITPTADRGGYWLVGSDGGIFSFGDSRFYGSIPGLGYAPAGTTGPNHLNAPIVGMVPSSGGGGYFMVASDGGVFAFGNAKFEGSCPGIGGCSGAAVAVMPDASGNGYWMVTATGHVYAFGDAGYYGAPGPQSSLATSAHRTPDGKGYWILFSNGAIASYGDAGFFGSPAGGLGGSDPATSILPTPDGGGYWVTSALGKVFNYGDAPNQGDMSGQPLNGSIIAAAGW